MLEENKYILYLKLTDEGHYIILAVTIGKIPLTNSEINSFKLKIMIMKVTNLLRIYIKNIKIKLIKNR